MRNSQYLHAYLSGNEARGVGRGLTVQTFLAYRLRGKAKRYADKYVCALERSLSRVHAIKGKSAGGRTAYYPQANGGAK